MSSGAGSTTIPRTAGPRLAAARGIPLLAAAVAGVGPGAMAVTNLNRRPAVIAVALISIALALPTLLSSFV